MHPSRSQSIRSFVIGRRTTVKTFMAWQLRPKNRLMESYESWFLASGSASANTRMASFTASCGVFSTMALGSPAAVRMGKSTAVGLGATRRARFSKKFATTQMRIATMTTDLAHQTM